MPEATKPLVRLSGSHGLFWVDMVYEDTDYREINDDGEPDDFRITQFFGTNQMDIPVLVGWKRGQGQKFGEKTIQPGDSFTQNAGGPVKYETDIPEHYIRPLG